MKPYAFTKGLAIVGCEECYLTWEVDENEEDLECPSCSSDNVFDVSIRYDKNHHELIYLDSYEIAYTIQEMKEKRNEVTKVST